MLGVGLLLRCRTVGSCQVGGRWRATLRWIKENCTLPLLAELDGKTQMRYLVRIAVQDRRKQMKMPVRGQVPPEWWP